MKFDKRIVLAAVAAFAFAWFLAHNTDGGFPNPFAPQRPDRPVLKFIAAAAKKLLWVAVFLEPRPDVPQSQHRHYIVRSTVGPDGNEYLDHGDL